VAGDGSSRKKKRNLTADYADYAEKTSLSAWFADSAVINPLKPHGCLLCSRWAVHRAE